MSEGVLMPSRLAATRYENVSLFYLFMRKAVGATGYVVVVLRGEWCNIIAKDGIPSCSIFTTLVL